MKNFCLTIKDDGLVTGLSLDTENEQEMGVLFIPAEVTCIESEALMGVQDRIADIVVEEDNAAFYVKNHTLYRTADHALVHAIAASDFAYDGTAEVIWDNAFSRFMDASLSPLKDTVIIPGGVKEIRYNSLSLTDKVDEIFLPASLEKVALISLMYVSDKVLTVNVVGDPVFETGAFGTKKELMDADPADFDEMYRMAVCTLKDMPEKICSKPESFLVRGLKGSYCEQYCMKYDIPFETVSEEEFTMRGPKGGSMESFCSMNGFIYKAVEEE